MAHPVCAPLPALQDWLKKAGYAALIVPQADPFQSEYVPAAFGRLAFLTGFQGSAGVAVVRPRVGVLFTDSRYTAQAELEAGGQFVIQNSQKQSYGHYLRQQLSDGQKIAFDPSLMTVAQHKALSSLLAHKAIALEPVTPNPLDAWWDLRPKLPNTALFTHPAAFAGATPQEKMSQVFKATKAQGLLLCDPVSIAWLFNLRAWDLPHTPVFLSYAFVERNGQGHVFLHAPKERIKNLDKAAISNVTFHDLDEWQKFITHWPGDLSVDLSQTPVSVYGGVKGKKLQLEPNPCLSLKARKNVIEQAGMRTAHLQDGVALCTFLCWLEAQSDTQGAVTEYEAAQKLDALRLAQKDCLGLSFPTISAAGPNGAMAHYRVEPKSARSLRVGELYLVDSGGQYWQGTTDVTRTVLYGTTPSPTHIDRYTRVLKGHIGIAQLVFPQGVTGAHIDVLARQHLWRIHTDYGHGTGHGVGHFLNVHEAPPSISLRAPSAPFEVGMVVSNEPGCYEAGAYGIRLENLIMVQKAPKCQENADDYLCFENLTCAPFDRRLIDIGALSTQELAYLNAYHHWVFESLQVFFDSNSKVRQWLKKACAPLPS